jgi:hypothetical protein
MSRDLVVKVRTLRPHHTTDGFKTPGDEYERTHADADKLAAGCVVAILAADATPAKRRAAGPRPTDPEAAGGVSPAPATPGGGSKVRGCRFA